MKLIAAVILFLLILASPCHAQTLTPQDARATLTVARAQATAAVEIATANAPTATMQPTWTPQPTATMTTTPEPTQTPMPTNTATVQPSATSAATATMMPSATATQIVATPEPASTGMRMPVELWCIVGILLMCAGIGIAMRMVSKWRR